MNRTGWPRTSTVAFPNLLVTLRPLFECDSNPPALFPGTLVDDAPRVLHPAEGAWIADGRQAANRAMTWAGWWRHGSLLMETSTGRWA